MPSPGTQPSIGSSSVYGIAPLSPSASAYTVTYHQAGASSNISKEQQSFPQRPDQPECQYFMRTGDCKFGSSCRYHHPLDAVPPNTGVLLSSIGLPLRPVSLFFFFYRHKTMSYVFASFAMCVTTFHDSGRSAMHSLCAARDLQVWTGV